eukprot:15188132-Alexandrium_andersonii.AAC.1
MSASLVGSEMCIRDSLPPDVLQQPGRLRAPLGHGEDVLASSSPPAGAWPRAGPFALPAPHSHRHSHGPRGRGSRDAGGRRAQ